MQKTIEQIQKLEAVKRLSFVAGNSAAYDFLRTGAIPVFEDGEQLENDETESIRKSVAEYEIFTGRAVYAIITEKNNSESTRYIYLLYVSNQPEKWEEEREDAKKGFPIALVINCKNFLLMKEKIIAISRNGNAIQLF